MIVFQPLLQFNSKQVDLISSVNQCPEFSFYTAKNGFVTATKLGTTNEVFLAATKNFAAATKRFVDRTKHFVVVTKYFCYPYFNKRFCWYNKAFHTVYVLLMDA